MNVLIIEDAHSVARFLEQTMHEAGFSVKREADGIRGLGTARSNTFDLILLDLLLPGMDGLEICRRLRGAGVTTPILIITARDRTSDLIAGLDAGADDYMVKPFEIGELLARVRALLRRAQPQFITLGAADLTLDHQARIATRDGKKIALSITEYALLEYLVRNTGRVVTRAMLLQHVWQHDFSGNDGVLDVYICYLRNKIDRWHPVPLIHTVRGVGYRFGDPDPE